MSSRPVLPTSSSARRALVALGALAAGRAVAIVLLMAAIAHALSSWAGGVQPDAQRLVVQGALGAFLLAACVWGSAILSRRAALGSKEELREQLLRHKLSQPGSNHTGADAILASRGLDGLDNYFASYLPAIVSSAVIPFLLLIQILIADWVSALIVVLTMPLVPVFMILIGFHTQERIEQAADSLARLSNNLLELAKGLPVLVGLRRAGAQRQALADVSERHRKATMGTLRTAFISAMALELIGTISVALVAVFIGVRLVYGEMPLEAGLLALMLAPECFKPLREVGAAHHASEDGVEALRQAKAMLDFETPKNHDGGVPRLVRRSPDKEALVVEAAGINVSFADRLEPALADFTLSLGRGERLVLDGVSGSGKSTALALLADTLPAEAAASGSLATPSRDSRVWVQQHPVFTEETVSAELELFAAGPDGLSVSEELMSRALTQVNALHLRNSSPLDCSPGELRRIAVARALARIANDPNVELALFDEPTAHLDPVSATMVREAIYALNGKVAVVVATHDQQLANGQISQPELETFSSAESLAFGEQGAIAPSSQQAPNSPKNRFRLSWLRRLPLTSPRFAAGVVVSALAVLSGAALSGFSAWLIVWAAAQPPMMYLMTVIVGVRTFGIGRSVLRYSERLLTHNAVFVWANKFRLDLWDSLANNIAHWGKLTRSGGSLGTLVSDVDQLRDALPRVVVPIPAAIISYGAMVLTITLIAPAATPVVVLLGVLSLLVLPLAVYKASNNAAVATAAHGSWLASRVTTLFGAADSLRANGVSGPVADSFAATDSAIAKPLRRLALGSGMGQGLVSLLTSLAAIASAALAINSGIDPRAAAVAAMLMLALIEPLGQYIEAVEQFPVLKSMMSRTMPLLDAAAGELKGGARKANKSMKPLESFSAEAASRTAIERINLDRVSARYPTMSQNVFSELSGEVTRGEWLSVSGPSGSGKSTLLAVLLGFLPTSAGSYTANGLTIDANALAKIAWCPQEAYLFNSTLRANLALARPHTAPPSDAELEQVLQTVGLGDWYSKLPAGLDTRVGPSGHNLSGGQRCRVSVARTLVAGADVVLLDEPTAHLGQDEGKELIADLRVALASASVVLVTHDAGLAASADSQLVLTKNKSLEPVT